MTAMQRAALTSVLAAVLIGTASAALAPTLAPPASGAGLTMVPAGRKLVRSPPWRMRNHDVTARISTPPIHAPPHMLDFKYPAQPAVVR
jgi:hypothetical protein